MTEFPKIDLLMELAKAAESVFKDLVAYLCRTSDFHEEAPTSKQKDEYI